MAVRTGPRAVAQHARLAVLGAFGVAGLAGGSWGARIPDVRDRLELSDGALGTALLGLSIGAVVGAWFGGVLARRVGSRRVVVASWVLVGVALALPGWAPGWPALVASLLALGLAVGVLDVAMNGAGVQLEVAAGRPLLSGLHAAWSGGVLLGAGLGSVAVAIGLSTRTHLGLIAVVIVATGVAGRAEVPDGRAAGTVGAGSTDTTDATGAGAVRERRRLIALAAIGGCVFLAEGAVLDWSGVYVRDDLDGADILGALAVTGLSAGGLLGRLAGDRLAARWGAPTLVRRGIVLAVVAFAAALALPVAPLVPVLLVAVGAGVAPAVPLAFAAAGRRRGEHGIAVVTTAGYGAYLAGPALIGWLAEAVSLRVALLVPLALVAALLALAWSTAIDG